MVIKWFFPVLPFWLLPGVQIFSFSSFSSLILGLWFSFGFFCAFLLFCVLVFENLILNLIF
jgi:hypothetical protein